MLDSLDTLIAFSLIFTVVSLLVTIVVQMITSVFNLRGLNLSWALAETFEAIEPDLAAQAKGKGKALADHVLCDALLSDKQFFSCVHRATAVRPDELFDVLHRIATGRKTAPADIKQSVIKLFVRLGVPEADLAGGAAVLAAKDQVLSALSTSVQSLPDDATRSAITAALANITAQMDSLAKTAVTDLTKTADAAQARITQAYQKFESWLDTGLERAQEWFSMHARVVTLIVGGLFAILLQLDAVDIFKTFSSDRAVRDKLVAQTDAVLGQGEKLLGARPAVLASAFAAWQVALPPASKAAVAAANLNVIPGDTRETFRQRVETALASLPDKTAAANALQQFDAAVDLAAKDALKQESADYARVKADFDQSGFSLFPPKGNRWPGEWSIGHVMGIALSILLLSLGAPFWFNTLKSLASLRSSVAGNISDEDEAAQKKGTAQKPGLPPPTVTPPATPAAGS